jgi:hypothetical protein
MKAVLLLAALSLAACGAPGSMMSAIPAGPSGSTRSASDLLGTAPAAKLKIMLFDAPISGYPGIKVNIGIDAVQLVRGATAVPFVTNSKPDVVNLLDLRTMSHDFDGSAAAGAYSAVRMLIDSGSSNVTIGKMVIPIVWGTPSKPISAPVIALDFPCTFLLTPLGPPTKVTLDFNVMQSVRFANGKIYVLPKVQASSSAAQVSGKIRNAAGTPVSNATVLAVDLLGHVVNSTVTQGDGTFQLHALPPGTYTIQVKNHYVTATGDTVNATGADAGAAPSALVILAPNDSLDLSNDQLVD